MLLLPGFRPAAAARQRAPLRSVLPVDQFDAHSVGRLDECDAGSWVGLGGVHREPDAFAAKSRAEPVEIALHLQAEVIDAPLQTGPVGRSLGRTFAPHDDHRTAQRYIDLGRPVDFAASVNRSAERVDVPASSGVRILGDEVNVIKGYAGVGHDVSPVWISENYSSRAGTSGANAAGISSVLNAKHWI